MYTVDEIVFICVERSLMQSHSREYTVVRKKRATFKVARFLRTTVYLWHFCFSKNFSRYEPIVIVLSVSHAKMNCGKS